MSRGRVGAPLVLLLAATLAFALVLMGTIFRPAVPPTPTTAPLGVAPYRPRISASAEVGKARTLYETGRYREAITALDEVLKRVPEDGYAHVLRENATIRSRGGTYFTLPFVTSMSGVDQEESLSDLQGIALAQEAANARGGVRGNRIVVDCYDDRSDTAQCLRIAESLLRDPKTVVVLGPLNSQRTLALAPLFNAARVSLVAPAVSSRKVWEAGPYVFSASESRVPRVQALARYAIRAGHRKIVALKDTTSQVSHEMVDLFEQEIKAAGGTVAALPFEREEKYFAGQVATIAEMKPDLIFFADYRGAPLGRFAQRLRREGLQTPICAQSTCMERHLVDVGGAAVNGVVLSECFHPELGSALTRRYVADFHKRFGDVTPTYPSAQNYDAFMAVVEGLNAASERASLMAYLRGRAAFEGVSGRFALGRCLDARPVWLIEVSEGRYRLLPGGPAGAAEP